VNALALKSEKGRADHQVKERREFDANRLERDLSFLTSKTTRMVGEISLNLCFSSDERQRLEKDDGS
jgi:hypothetical protein